jgi:uncharacterized membrane protein
LLIVWAVRWLTQDGQANTSRAHDILDERLARGEIDPVELRNLRRELSHR